MKRFSLSAWIWIVLAAVYFLIPLLATLLFSIKDKQTGNCCSLDRKSTRLNSSHIQKSRMPSSA